MAVPWPSRLTVGLVLVPIAALLWSGSATALLGTVQVTDDGLGITRACGSPFDAMSGRTGWETWWAGDLDEPEEAVRRTLVRTSRCPDALNRSIAAATALGGLGACSACFTWLFLRRPARHAVPPVQGLARLGWAVGLGGAALTLAGVGGTLALVADPDSTIFLYTSRTVVAAGGLLLCVPALALAAGGRALVILAGIVASGEEIDDA